MTVRELLNMGYQEADAKYTRGYVSRKIDTDNAEVHVAGGKRKGQYYALVPCWSSTQYCLRQYFGKIEN